MKKINRYVINAATLVVAAVLLFPAGCGSSDNKTFSIKEGVQGFSFEYPSSYSLVRIDLSNTADSAYTTVGLGTKTGDSVNEIYVYVWPTSPDLSTAAATIDELLTNAQSVLNDFKLDKKSASTVGGQIAAGASFTATDTGAGSSSPEGPAYYRITVYVHNDLIFEIDMTCPVSLKDSTQPQYDKLLQSFSSLD